MRDPVCLVLTCYSCGSLSRAQLMAYGMHLNRPINILSYDCNNSSLHVSINKYTRCAFACLCPLHGPLHGWSIQVLPILSVSGVDDAIAKTNQICSQPLALYVYAEDQGVIDK